MTDHMFNISSIVKVMGEIEFMKTDVLHKTIKELEEELLWCENMEQWKYKNALLRMCKQEARERAEVKGW